MNPDQFWRITPIEFWWLIDDAPVEPRMSIERLEELERKYGDAHKNR